MVKVLHSMVKPMNAGLFFLYVIYLRFLVFTVGSIATSTF